MPLENKDAIKKVYQDFKESLEVLAIKRKQLLSLYRAKIEEVKIKEIKDSIETTSI